MLVLLMTNMVAGQTAPTDDERDRLRLHAGAGATVNDRGYVVSGGFGFSPASRLELLLNVERIHLPFQMTGFRDGSAVTRGGTMTFASGELRVALRRPGGVSPFVLAGAGGGVARPNVNASFPDPVTNSLRVGYVGGGLHVPLRRGFTLWGDGRAMLALEGNDGVLAMLPVRAGLSWAF
jgi:hypothetical protein